jgi:hypothetical protein
MRDIAARHHLSLLQLACLWNLSQPAVQSVIPTFIQEIGSSKSIESKVDEMASLPDLVLSADDIEQLAEIGDNRGCMDLKGASAAHTGQPLPDRWGLTAEHTAVAQRWGIDPQSDLACTHRSPA